MKIYLDDNHQGDRPAPEGWVAAHTFAELKQAVEEARKRNETIEAISFDNDLGEGEPEGHKIMKWLSENHPELLVNPEQTEITIHSANPPATEEMRGFLDSCRRHRDLLISQKERPETGVNLSGLK